MDPPLLTVIQYTEGRPIRASLVDATTEWVLQALDSGLGEDKKVPCWTGGISVGAYELVESVQFGLGPSVRRRSIVE